MAIPNDPELPTWSRGYRSSIARAKSFHASMGRFGYGKAYCFKMSALSRMSPGIPAARFDFKCAAWYDMNLMFNLSIVFSVGV